MKPKAPKRGIPLRSVHPYIQRVMVVRNGEFLERTNQVSEFGNKLWRAKDGRLVAYSPQTRVKPVFKYSDIFHGNGWVDAVRKGENDDN